MYPSGLIIEFSAPPDITPDEQYRLDDQRWEFRHRCNLTTCQRLDTRESNPRCCVWTGNVLFGAEPDDSDQAEESFRYDRKWRRLIVDTVSVASWVYAKDYNDVVSGGHGGGKIDPALSSLPVHRPYIPGSTREGEIVSEGAFAVEYNDGTTVKGGVCADDIFFNTEPERTEYVGHSHFGTVKHASRMWLSRPDIDGVLGLSMQRYTHTDLTENNAQEDNILVGMLRKDPNRADVVFSIDISPTLNGKLMGHLTFYTYNLGGPWLPVDHRGCGYWALKLRQIKWTFKDQQQDKGANELNFDAPLILDIGTRYCYFNDNFLSQIHSSVSGKKTSHGWEIPIASQLPETIEFIIEDTGSNTTMSIPVPGSVLRHPYNDNNTFGFSTFQSLCGPLLLGTTSSGGDQKTQASNQEPCLFGSIALQYIKTYYRYSFEADKQFISVYPVS